MHGVKREHVRILILEAIGRGLNVKQRANGISMFPYIWPRETVTVRPLSEGENPPTGSILVINRGRGQSFLVHRLVARDGETIITRGDSILHVDKGFSPADIVGVVISAAGRFSGRERAIPADGGIYWLILRTLSPFSYVVNNIGARLALTAWRIIGIFSNKKRK